MITMKNSGFEICSFAVKCLDIETDICVPDHNIKEYKLIKMQVCHQMWPESENKALLHKCYQKLRVWYVLVLVFTKVIGLQRRGICSFPIHEG